MRMSSFLDEERHHYFGLITTDVHAFQ